MTRPGEAQAGRGRLHSCVQRTSQAFDSTARGFCGCSSEALSAGDGHPGYGCALIPTNKKEALYCYKGPKAYQPLQVYWAEQDLVLHSEFRDGNVWAGTDNLRVLQEGLAVLPEGVSKASLRTDSATYQHDAMSYCAEGKNERFGIIDFAISVKISESFKKARREVPESEWHKLYR